MAHVVRTRRKYQEARQREWQDVCSQYPNGPNGYRLVPARCVQQESRSRARPNNTLSQTAMQQRQIKALYRRIPALRESTRIMHEAAAHADPTYATSASAQEAMLIASEFNKMLIEAPAVVQHTSLKMLDSSLIQQLPNVDLRYEKIVTDNGAEVFEKYAPVKLAVFEIALSLLEGAISHPSH